MHNEKLMDKILSTCAAMGFEFDTARREQLLRFIEELLQWSGRIHLIGKRNAHDTIRMQVVDSLLMLRFAATHGVIAGEGGWKGYGSQDAATESPEGVRVADIGSGAGFPGIIWKIASPDLDVTLYERRRKPLRFLERTIAVLGMPGIGVRGVDAARSRETGSFDVVVSKAAGRLDQLLPIAAGILRGGGMYITIKGKGWEKEADSVKPALFSLRSSEALPGGRGTALLFDICRE
ncbi:MAG: class I SAM-dependent methyltransferase [bacterium]|nr:MAG: class I SAM-dependent methyltransferase [bacterium]